MNKCAIDERQIRNKVAQLFYVFKKNNQSVTSLKTNIIDLLRNVIPTNVELENIDSIVEIIDNVSNRSHISEQIPDFFNSSNIKNIILAVNKNISINNPTESSIDQILDRDQVKAMVDTSRVFLDDAYGFARQVKMYAENIANENLFDCCFINRGSLDQKIGIVQSNSELNNNIRNYQQKLLDTITTYLQSIISNADFRIKENKQLRDILQSTTLYDSDNKNTGILEKLEPFVNSYLRNLTPNNLMELYNDMNNSTFSEEKRKKAKERLQAYNAMVVLYNFDNYLTVSLGKAITISDFGLKTGEDKYQISDKTAKLLTSWRVTENINVEEEADMVTKLAINTTPIYKDLSETIREGKYLQFSDFQHLISKIKDLVFDIEASKMKFDERFQSRYKDIWEDFSEDTRKLFNNKTLASGIAYIRKNPRKYLHCIFEVLNDSFIRDNYSSLFKKFTKSELDKLYSIHKGIFNGSNSLRNLITGDYTTDFYAYITQTADSIFNVQYIQYYRDSDGIIQVRTFLDQSINNIKRNIEQSINNWNSQNLITNWDDYRKQFNFDPKYEDDTLRKLSFTIPNTDIRVDISISSGDVHIIRDNGIVTNYQSLYDQVVPFIYNTLQIDLKNNVELQELLIEQMGDLNSTIGSLLQFASRVISNKFISNEEIPTEIKTSKDVKAYLEKLMGRGVPHWNYATDEMGLVHGSDIDTLKRIANALANLRGLTTSTQVKDGEGNGQSQQTLSRLLGSFQSQFELQERIPEKRDKNGNIIQQGSASRNFILLNDPGLLEGVYSFKEFYDDESKSATDMSVSEMSYAALVYDFIGSFINDEDSLKIVGNGHALFLTSVNSDKNTMSKIRINLNRGIPEITKIDSNGNTIPKPFNEYTSEELEWLISREFGDFYSNMYENITQDWQTVDNIIKQTLIGVPSLKSDFKYGFQKFNQWFAQNKDNLKQYGNTPAEFIKYFVRIYNTTHRLNPLEITDQDHYKEDKQGNLSINQTIIAQIARFNPNHSIFKEDSKLLEQYPTSKQFWNYKKVEALKSLLKDRFIIDTIVEDQPELKYLRNNYPEWIDRSGNVILAKFGNTNITTQVDLLRLGINNINTIADKIQLNPLIERYNYLDYLFSQEFMASTVGSFVAHPDKSKSSNVIEQEASQFQAQHKRNVSYTAAMHEFQLNQLNGITEDYNIAVIRDIIDEQGTIIGLLNTMKPYDGATFVNPFNVILENNSLCGAKAGITKKQFVHFKNEKLGTGGIIKTAGFGLTNDWIRNSPLLENMMRKMTDHIWLNKDNTPAIVDITKSYKGNKIEYKDFYFKQGDKYFQITKIESLGNNTYQRTIQEVTEDGSAKVELQEIDQNGKPIGTIITTENLDSYPIVKQNGKRYRLLTDKIKKPKTEEPKVINTNYQLWNYFGGKNSMTIKNRFLEYSNTSVENVVEAMNNVSNEQGKLSNTIETQEDLWQPLKHVDVHYVVTEGAIKQGAANINSNSRYMDDIPYDIQKIHMYQAGIQLDKEHHADGSELSLMTQVMSACAAKGYTIDTAMDLYKALRTATDKKTKEDLEVVSQYFNTKSSESLEALQTLLMKSIIKVLGSPSSNQDNFAYLVAKDLIRRSKNGEVNLIEEFLPLSDNTIAPKITSSINSYLTKAGIKQKIPGILSVLTPSYGIFKLYGGRKFESFIDPDVDLLQMQQEILPVYDITNPTTNISNLELGRSYYITRDIDQEFYNEDTGEIYTVPVPLTEIQLVRTPTEYRKLKQEIASGKVTRVVEAVYDIENKKPIGRDLAGYNVRFNTDQGSFQIWDLDSSSTLFELNELKENWKGSEQDIQTLKDIVKDAYNYEYTIEPNDWKVVLEGTIKRTNRWLQHDLMNLSKSNPNILEQYQKLISTKVDQQEWYNRFAQWVNIVLGTGKGNVIFLNGEQLVVNSDTYRTVAEKVFNKLKELRKVRINKTFQEVDKNSIKESAYELIMPKTFATAFGLTEFDDLNTIINDPDYFIIQYLRNQTTKVNEKQYTIEFKRSNGNHLYVLNKKAAINSGLTKLEGICTLNDDGKLYRVDASQNILYEITPDTEIYVDNEGNEVIVSDDIKFYVDNLSYDTIKLSDRLRTTPSFLTSIVDILGESSNKVAKRYNKYLIAKGNRPVYILEANKMYHSITEDNYLTDEDAGPIIRLGRRKHTSFLRSLDIVAARIPAQSMQSYMPMKVVAFDNPDINTAYVSTYQILLQGSDYDVDAVSLATFDIDENGILQLWSPYANIESDELRKASETLPTPTGKKVNIEETDNYQQIINFFLKYRTLFNIERVRTRNVELEEENTRQAKQRLNEAKTNLNILKNNILKNNNSTDITELAYAEKELNEAEDNFNKVKATQEWDINPNEVSVDLILDTPEKILLFANLLKETTTILKPSKAAFNSFRLDISKIFNTIDFTDQQEWNIFDKLQEIIDKHNLYYEEISDRKLSRIINNYTMKAMYDTIINPVNLIEAQTSVDGTTGPLKKIADDPTRPQSQEAKYRTAGNVFNKFESIIENQVGKECIGICATGLKAFFGLTQYSNWILNNGTSEQQQRLLIGKNGQGYKIGNKTYKTLANIRSKDPNTITNADVLEALSNVTNDEDAALVLSALLSLSTDFRTIIKILRKFILKHNLFLLYLYY